MRVRMYRNIEGLDFGLGGGVPDGGLTDEQKAEAARIEQEKKDEAFRARMDKMRQQMAQLPPEVLNMDVSNLEESIRRIIRKQLLK
jgi:3-deoxy-D-arabino-heptulosonate 7-phosphate (DAHP) synthase class II